LQVEKTRLDDTLCSAHKCCPIRMISKSIRPFNPFLVGIKAIKTAYLFRWENTSQYWQYSKNLPNNNRSIL